MEWNTLLVPILQGLILILQLVVAVLQRNTHSAAKAQAQSEAK